MDTELFDFNAPEEQPAAEPALAPERPDIELYLDQIAGLRDVATRELIARRAYWKGEVEDREANLKHELIRLTPDGGWPGSNETARNTARDKTLAVHPRAISLKAKVSMAKYDLDMIDAEIEARADERKTAEFKLRELEAKQRERDLVLREAELEARIRDQNTLRVRSGR